MAAMNGPNALADRSTTSRLSRGGRLLFEGIGFALAPGELLLLRGPNGAGKSSLLLTLAGMLRPGNRRRSTGDAEEPPPLHLLGHQPAVKPRLTLAENLQLLAQRQRRDRAARPTQRSRRSVSAALGELDAGYLSAGQTRRLALARLLVSRPPDLAARRADRLARRRRRRAGGAADRRARLATGGARDRRDPSTTSPAGDRRRCTLGRRMSALPRHHRPRPAGSRPAAAATR